MKIPWYRDGCRCIYHGTEIVFMLPEGSSKNTMVLPQCKSKIFFFQVILGEPCQKKYHYIQFKKKKLQYYGIFGHPFKCPVNPIIHFRTIIIHLIICLIHPLTSKCKTQYDSYEAMAGVLLTCHSLLTIIILIISGLTDESL